MAAGSVDLAISYEPEVLLAHDQGLPVKAVAAVVPTPLTSLIWLEDSGIRGVNDLRGKTIATAGIPYQAAYLDTILERSGLSSDDAEVVDVQQGLLPAILSGRADAMLGGFLNVEGVGLVPFRGKNPTVIPVDRLGIPTYNELVLVANSDRLDDDSRDIRLFIAALERGTKAAAADPKAATENLLEAGKGLDSKAPHGRSGATDDPPAPAGEGHGVRLHAPEGVAALRGVLRRRRPDRGPADAGDVLTNDLLPGRIPG